MRSRGHLGGVGVPVGEDEDLARPGDHVDVHPAEDEPLRGGDVGVPRPADLVHGGEGGGPVRERRDGLRPAHPEQAGHPGDVAGGERPVVHLARAPHARRADVDLAHAGDLRRDGGHEDRRRVAGGAARHVQPHARERPDHLREGRADGVALARHLGVALAAVEGLDAPRREGERLSALGGQAPVRRLHGVLAQGDAGGGARVPAVEAAGVLEERRVAAGAHVLHDPLRRPRGPGPSSSSEPRAHTFAQACRNAGSRVSSFCTGDLGRPESIAEKPRPGEAGAAPRGALPCYISGRHEPPHGPLDAEPRRRARRRRPLRRAREVGEGPREGPELPRDGRGRAAPRRDLGAEAREGGGGAPARPAVVAGPRARLARAPARHRARWCRW